MDIKALNDITGQILRFEEKVDHTKRWIERIENLSPLHNSFNAEVEVKVSGCGGFKHNGKFSLTTVEVLYALKRDLAEQERILELHKAEFAKMQ